MAKVRIAGYSVSLDGGETGPDDDFAARGLANLGAGILGRTMFPPGRGPWPVDGMHLRRGK